MPGALFYPPPCGEGGRPNSFLLGRSGGGATNSALVWGFPTPAHFVRRPSSPSEASLRAREEERRSPPAHARRRRASGSPRSHARCTRRPAGWAPSAAAYPPRQSPSSPFSCSISTSGSAAKLRPKMARSVPLQIADLVLALVAPAEISAVAVVHQREDAAAHRHARVARVPRRLPGVRDRAGSARPAAHETACRSRRSSASMTAGSCPCLAAHSAVALVEAPHQMRSRRPSLCGSSRSRPGGFGNIGLGFGCAKPLPCSTSRNTSVCRRAMSASVWPSGRRVTEIAVAVDHLLRRAAGDAELQPPAAIKSALPASSAI